MSNQINRNIFLVTIFLGVVFLSCCHRTKPVPAKRYPFTGRIVAIDTQAQSAVIDGDLIQGYMEAMVMTYKIKPPSMLRQLAPGDSVAAEVVVVDHDPRDETVAEESWLENVKIIAHAQQPPAAAVPRMPSAGEEVPDFSLTNQDGKRISLNAYRGKTLLVTFIYTRCPFPDFCPRMSGNFAEIHKQLGSNPALGNAHLLSISFDPEHDTPKVLRNYGFSVAHADDPALFRRWEFAVPAKADLPKIADFFALTVKSEGGLITHNLSTALIGPDGRIVNWYHGDWQVKDVVQDASSAAK